MQNFFAKHLIRKSKIMLTKSTKGFSILIKKKTGKEFINKKFVWVEKRGFSAKEEKKQEKEGNEQQNENKQEQEGNKQENQEQYEQENNEETTANYKTSRKIRFFVGKTIKWFFILGGLLTMWNAYLYKKKANPKEHKGYFESCNKLVRKIHYFWFLTYGTLTLPYYEKILPDALELVGQPSKKTLVINLNKTLINYEYKFGSGFEILKRPGLLKFLQEMGQHYEVVIFGTEDSNFVEEVAGKLDQFEMNIRYKLGKEATRLVNRRYVKDLHFLNRDLKSVVCIDYDPDNVMFNPENVLIIPEFLGDGKDRELIQAIVFLKELAKPEVKDVRKEFEKFGNYRTYINFYKSNPKYKRLLPKEDAIPDDADLQSATAKKN